jgi:large subunit ribosomal protein L22
MAKEAVKENKVVEVKAHVKTLRISPRKMRLITNLVKNMWADEAVAQLQFTNKKGARYVAEAIKSAIANGSHNFNMKKEQLFVKAITCDQGPVLKRFMPRAQGRATPIRKPTTHLHVVLAEKEGKRKGVFAVQFKGRVRKAAEAPSDSDDTDTTDKKGIKGSQIGKSEQKVKENTVQNKRRLFNRKSGV